MSNYYKIRFTNKFSKQENAFLLAFDEQDARIRFQQDYRGKYKKINKITQQKPVTKRVVKLMLTPRI